MLVDRRSRHPSLLRSTLLQGICSVLREEALPGPDICICGHRGTRLQDCRIVLSPGGAVWRPVVHNLYSRISTSSLGYTQCGLINLVNPADVFPGSGGSGSP